MLLRQSIALQSEDMNFSMHLLQIRLVNKINSVFFFFFSLRNANSTIILLLHFETLLGVGINVTKSSLKCRRVRFDIEASVAMVPVAIVLLPLLLSSGRPLFYPTPNSHLYRTNTLISSIVDADMQQG